MRETMEMAFNDLLEAAEQARAWLQDYALHESGQHEAPPVDAAYEHNRLTAAILKAKEGQA